MRSGARPAIRDVVRNRAWDTGDASADRDAPEATATAAAGASPRAARRQRSASRPRARPALDGPERTREPVGRLLGGRALEQAQDQDLPELRRQLAQLGVEDRPDVEPICPNVLEGPDVDRHRRVNLTPSGISSSRLGCHAGRNSVKPRPQAIGIAELPGLLNQHQERRLEGVVGIVTISEHTPTNAEHHRPMPRDDRFERRFVARGNEALEQRSVAGG